MSRSMATRRRGLRAQVVDDASLAADSLVDESEQRAERLDADNARLRAELAEVEGWYGLLRADHASLRARHEQVGRKAGELHAELDRLGSRNRELEALVDRPAGPGRAAGSVKDGTTMIRINDGLRSLRRHKWASAALVAFATLLARDPGVQGLFHSALSKVRELGKGGDPARDPSASGFVLYAAMIQARDDAEKARADYNDREATLKGDALLEAQDRLRAAKARYRQARLAFLPELARQCEQVKLPVPREATEALAMLRQESRD
jgi:hypothetical protein